jgi:hypothetical protein
MKLSDGFSLLTAMMLVLFMISFSLFLHLRIRTQWQMAADVESQLYSLVLAENGIEYARTLLPHMELNLLLAGLDGTFSGTHSSEWRNPMSFAEALRVDPSTWKPPHDDGLPIYDGQSLLPRGHQGGGGGYFFLKFSNNPEESPEHDEDHIILVRSLGIVPTPVQNLFFPHLRNSVALLEARFRQERAFSLPSPLTLLGSSGSFQWEGEHFSIESPERFTITLISTSPSTLHADLVGSLSPSQEQRIRRQGVHLSIQEASPQDLTEPLVLGLLNPGFWNHFLAQLPRFTDEPPHGIVFLPDGGVFNQPLSGILIAQKDLILGTGAQIKGLLLHLGQGQLILRGQSQVIGGIWMSNFDSTGKKLKAGPIALRLSDSSAIHYNQAAIREAQTLLPPTQVGWRILFPETVE